MQLFNPRSFIQEEQKLGLPDYIFLSIIINTCRAPLTLEGVVSHFP